METTNENISRLLEMLDNPSAYSEQEIQNIINHDDETREAYRLMVAAKQGYRHKQTLPTDVDAAWQRFEQKHYTQRQPSPHWWMRVAAIFIAAAFLCGLSYAAYQVVSSKQTTEIDDKYAKEKMLGAYFVPKDCKNPIVKRRGDAITVKWLKGTWVQYDDDAFIEEHPTGGYMLHLMFYTIKLDGKELDIHNLPDHPASALKKVEILSDSEWHWQVNLITTPVQVPADVKGNVNPELTILLTGIVPKGAYQPVTIWKSVGIKDSYDWHDYIYTSWTGQWENVRIHLNEVVNRKDHHVRINVCKGTPQKHIDRIKSIMRECNVTNYEFVKQ